MVAWLSWKDLHLDGGCLEDLHLGGKLVVLKVALGWSLGCLEVYLGGRLVVEGFALGWSLVVLKDLHWWSLVVLKVALGW